MSTALELHNFIDEYNVLQQPTGAMGQYFDAHPDLYKVALLANHLFRAAAMVGLGMVLPFSVPVSAGICFLGSLFYRLTVETHCAYKFALPAFAGSAAFMMGWEPFLDLITGVAFASLSCFLTALLSLVPLVAYISYIVLTVSYDVDSK